MSLAVVWDKSEVVHLSHDFAGNQDASLNPVYCFQTATSGEIHPPLAPFLTTHFPSSERTWSWTSPPCSDVDSSRARLRRGLASRSSRWNIYIPTAGQALSGVSRFPWPSCFKADLQIGRWRKDLSGCSDKFIGSIGNKIVCAHFPSSFPQEMSYLHW